MLNRFIDDRLHIGLGIVTWALRKRVGLRALRDAPGEATRDHEPIGIHGD